jgi:hypothetical protein
MAQEREPKRTPNVDAAGWPDDEYSADLGHGNQPVDAGDTTAATRLLAHHEAPHVRERLGDRADTVSVFHPRTRLRQGATYLDLDRLERGPFVAGGAQDVEEGQLIVSKKLLDHETWNELLAVAAELEERERSTADRGS